MSVLRDGSRTTWDPITIEAYDWENPTAGHLTCCVRGWWLSDFPQRLLQEEPAPHLQEMVILSWLSCMWPLSKGTEKEVTARHFCRALQSHSRAGCAHPAQLMCTCQESPFTATHTTAEATDKSPVLVQPWKSLYCHLPGSPAELGSVQKMGSSHHFPLPSQHGLPQLQNSTGSSAYLANSSPWPLLMSSSHV